MQTSIPPRTNTKDLWFRILIVTIITTGILLRASKYIPGWSMRGDELHVTLNLVSRSPIELATKPLDYEQAAPFAFLLLTKALLSMFGPSEYVLRAVSFLAGCAALWLLYKLLDKVTGKFGAVFALLAFAFAYYPIYYGAELKQYSSDILICIILLFFFHRHVSEKTSLQDFWQLAAIGVLAVSFSHPIIFVLIGVGSMLFLHYWNDRQKRIWIGLVGVVWAGFFLAVYLILLRQQTGSEYLVTFWRNLRSFMPMPPWEEPVWFFDATRHLFTTLSGFRPISFVILAPVYLYGQWLFFKEQNWQWIGVTLIPIGINMLVSGFEKFPFHGRLIIYLLPLVYIVLAKGVSGVMMGIRNRVAAITAYAALLLVLILPPAISNVNTFLVTQSYLQDDMKPILAHVSEQIEPGDVIYLYHYTNRQFDYYGPQYGLDDVTILKGENRSQNGRKYLDDFSLLPRDQRIWFVFSFVGDTRIDKTRKVDEREYMLSYLTERGDLLEEIYSTNHASSVHLFILKK